MMVLSLLFQCLPPLLSACLLLVVPVWVSVGTCLLINFSTQLMPSTESLPWKRLQERASHHPGPRTVQEAKNDECKEAGKRHKASDTQQIRAKARTRSCYFDPLSKTLEKWLSTSHLSSGRIGKQREQVQAVLQDQETLDILHLSDASLTQPDSGCEHGK